jgi:hypothetical protein
MTCSTYSYAAHLVGVLADSRGCGRDDDVPQVALAGELLAGLVEPAGQRRPRYSGCTMISMP